MPGGRLTEHDVVGPHGEVDVLELLVAQILKREIELVANVLTHRAGNGNSTGFCDPFKPRGDVHSIPEDVVIIDNHVAQIDSNPEFDAAVIGNPDIAGAHFPLNFGRAFDRIHNAGEFDEHPIAGQFDNPPVMLRNGRIDELGAVSLEAGQCADFIRAHKAAVAHYIGGHDRGQSAFHWDNCPKQLVPSLAQCGTMALAAIARQNQRRQL
ncbi:MAG TPA: hypothetical protein VNJ05_06740 [Sphingomicrobium sp.]|nr:hypothetical protein [Sphingomicrobium sp.]